MSRVVVCILLFLIGNNAKDVSNYTDIDFETDNLQTMQKFEETARRQWELTARKKPTTAQEEVVHPESLSSDTVELFTWFPWFEKNRPTIHTIKAIAALKKENATNIPAILGVGSWQEITLFGKKKSINSIEEPDARPLCRSTAHHTKNALKWFIIIAVYLSLATLS